MKMISCIAAAAVAAIAAVPGAAITTFATFSPNSNVPNIAYAGVTAGTGSVTSVAAPVTFHFLDPLGTTSVADFVSTLTLNATTAGGNVAYGLGIAPVTSGTFSFTAAAPVTFNGKTGTNLLSGTFTGGAFTGLIGGSAASYINSAPPSMVSFTSDFLNFASTTARDISLAINAINPSIAATSSGLGDFSGTVSGNFGADLTSGSAGGVPEPAAWGLMVVGFGLVGAMARRRSPRAVAA